MGSKGTILYIGGFELPDKNAAAQRVVGIAKGFRECGYDVVFLNSLKTCGHNNMQEKNYFGFKCYEYKREPYIDYLIAAWTVRNYINEIHPDIVVAYNYPGFALERIRKYCKANAIKCIADATEWYQIKTGNPIYRVIRNMDADYCMKIVLKRLDGVIAISRFLYEYYKDYTNTVMIPPTVDITDAKWNVKVEKDVKTLTFIYAGSPSMEKERLDLIVEAVEGLKTEKTVRLNILGITKEQYAQIYGRKKGALSRVKFWGRVDHDKVIEFIKSADWSIILRDNNFGVNAGFPTKLVESISCGTPVILNRFSNVGDYVNERNSVLLEIPDDLKTRIGSSMDGRLDIDASVFDYHNYLRELIKLLTVTTVK